MDRFSNFQNFEVENATTADFDELSEFFSIAQISNRHLDWKKSISWLGYHPFLKCYKDKNLVSVMICPVTDDNFVWIRNFCAISLHFAENTWPYLFQYAEDQLIRSSISKIYTIALSPWYIKLLANAGFDSKTEIVTLHKDNSHYSSHTSGIELEEDLLIRDFLPEDLENVVAVDHLAFPPLWRIAKEDLIQALDISQNKSVVSTRAGKIIGYQISSNIFSSGHIARVAILPEFHRKKVASALLDNLMMRFSVTGINEVTVNTSSDNIPAINLYLKHGFSHTQNNYPIYTKYLNNL